MAFQTATATISQHYLLLYVVIALWLSALLFIVVVMCLPGADDDEK